MQVHRHIEDLPQFRRAVVTIGTFDGVHTGHRQIIDQLINEAARVNGESVIITFHPHPRKVVHADRPPIHLITTIEERIELFSACGVDHLVIIPFTDAFAQQPAEAYVEDFLIRYFHPDTVIIGYDHRFGKDRQGDYQLLEKYSEAGAFRLMEIPGHLLHSSMVSSTRIRATVQQGDMEEARLLLGYDFFFGGLVVRGDQLGRKIGFPTANLLIENQEKLLPGTGVYAVRACLGSMPNDSRLSLTPDLRGMMNIGYRPTINGQSLRYEVNLFHFDRDIYDFQLRIFVIHYLRGEIKFDGIAALQAQLARDREAAEKALGRKDV